MIILLLRDSIEIIFYSCVFYTFALWLKTDKTKNLLPYFISYCMIALCAWIMEMTTLTSFFFTYAPVALLLFIVLHEKTLQKNLVALYTFQPAKYNNHDWLDTLISSCLTILNTNKSITIVIEHYYSLKDFMHTPFFINADISKGILDIILASTSYDEHKMVWINTQGKLYGINASWHTSLDQQKNVIQSLHHKADALFYSLQTDALIIHFNHITRKCSLIIQGQETTHLSAHQLPHKKTHSLIAKQSYKGKIS